MPLWLQALICRLLGRHNEWRGWYIGLNEDEPLGGLNRTNVKYTCQYCGKVVKQWNANRS